MTRFRILLVAAALAVSALSAAVSARALASPLAAGGAHACALTGGAVKCWGANVNGQLGNGTWNPSVGPVAVSGLSTGVSAVAAGGGHTCALFGPGAVSCWGNGWAGELGNGDTRSSNVPVAVSGLGSGVSAVTAGAYDSCALSSGAVRCWGDNLYGQLGDDDKPHDSDVPVLVHGLASGVTAVAAGKWHACAVTAGGTVKCWGHNWAGQLGDGSDQGSDTPVGVAGLVGATAVAAGGDHTCALTASTVKCWGFGSFGQLGDGKRASSKAPVSVSGLPAAPLAVVAGDAHTCALLAGGSVACWGRNAVGQLGDGTTDDAGVPVLAVAPGAPTVAIAAGDTHTCAMLVTGAVKCWGSFAVGMAAAPTGGEAGDGGGSGARPGARGDGGPSSGGHKVAPRAIKFARAVKVKRTARGRRRVAIAVRLVLPPGVRRDEACKGALTYGARLAGAHRDWRGRARLAPVADGCRAVIRLVFSETPSARRVVLTVVHGGNDVLSAFQRSVGVKLR